ncbi:hypothetical protein KXD40_004324 [Peronospora effusa]|uniref:RxLR effector protein n=1 Tax=Peronospora effusa TaxID=542832 RepID=A0A3M6VIC8_9STRA|nr:hypothetical protein DD238_006909 [Peronospora effusa]UIZ27858.1 hypothetical protein KXD40_004324 [Peronospora effusa]
MACSINKVKHLFWYMVLVTVVVLIWSPQTMAKMVVASQHAPRDTREKRQLRSSSSTTKGGNDGDEERMEPRINLDSRLNIGPDIDEGIVARIPKVDEDAKSLLESARLMEWYNSLGHATAEKHLNTAILKLSDLIADNGKERVISMLKTAKADPATKQMAADLEIILKLNQHLDETTFSIVAAGMDDVTTILKSSLLQNFLKLYTQLTTESPFPLLFNELMQRFGEEKLPEYLLEAQKDKATKETAELLLGCQIEYWEDYGYSDDDVIKLLGLKKGAIYMHDSPKWPNWALYRKMLNNKNVFRNRASAEESLWGRHSTQAPETRKRQQNDGEAPAPAKRQRNDDGQ